MRLRLLLALPIVLFFSYHPVFPIASLPFMHLELSLPLLWLAAYDLVSLIAFIRLFRQNGWQQSLHGLSDAKFFLLSLFPLYATASALWSGSPTRALLTAGLAWALFFALFSTYQLLRLECCKNYNTFWQKFKHILYPSTAAVCAFCWLQCLLDLLGVPREQTLLCAGCTYASFGFPHPSGFAIEPQFMGNLLLAPIFLLLFDLIQAPKRPSPRRIALLFFFLATLFLTFSRGAIYAFAVALALTIVVRLIQTKTAKPLASLVLAALAFLLTLTAQGLMAQFSPTTDTFATGVTKSIHHLSLGQIDLRPLVEKPVENSTETDQNTPEDSYFDGYVAASTDVRVGLTERALALWTADPAALAFGVGLGGAGTALSQTYPVYSPKEIIQNQYISLALETGFLGLATLVITATLVIQKLRRTAKAAQTAKSAKTAQLRASKILLFSALALAYAVSLLFFSGLQNALHIYFFLTLTLINAII